jgi:dihydrofolate reductase
MAPMGGAFVAVMGVFVLLGSAMPKLRMTFAYVGLGAATLALILSGRLAAGLPAPTKWQVGWLVVAIIVEFVAFATLMPRMRVRGQRAVLASTLLIVGAHFLIMFPAFGPLIALVATLCVANAAAAWRWTHYRTEIAWLIDGLIKVAGGLLLVTTSPAILIWWAVEAGQADRVFEDPIHMGLGEYQDEAYLRDALGLFEACDAILFGRSTYEIFATVYGGGGGTPVYAARLKAIRKYVFSSSLQTTAWNNSTIVRGDVVAEVTKLKQQEGGDLLLLGHGLLSETLLQQRLIDVLDLSILPVIVGHGKPFFREGQAVKVKLAATKSFSKIVKVTYEPQY